MSWLLRGLPCSPTPALQSKPAVSPPPDWPPMPPLPDCRSVAAEIHSDRYRHQKIDSRDEFAAVAGSSPAAGACPTDEYCEWSADFLTVPQRSASPGD